MPVNVKLPLIFSGLLVDSAIGPPLVLSIVVPLSITSVPTPIAEALLMRSVPAWKSVPPE